MVHTVVAWLTVLGLFHWLPSQTLADFPQRPRLPTKPNKKLFPKKPIHIYWINADNRPEQRAAMYGMLKGRDFLRIAATQPQDIPSMVEAGQVVVGRPLPAEVMNAQLATIISHLAAIRQALLHEAEVALVLQDHVSLAGPAALTRQSGTGEQSRELWSLAACTLRHILNQHATQWEIVQLLADNATIFSGDLKRLRPRDPRFKGAQAYLINRSGMLRLMHKFALRNRQLQFNETAVDVDAVLYQSLRAFVSPLPVFTFQAPPPAHGDGVEAVWKAMRQRECHMPAGRKRADAVRGSPPQPPPRVKEQALYPPGVPVPRCAHAHTKRCCRSPAAPGEPDKAQSVAISLLVWETTSYLIPCLDSLMQSDIMAHPVTLVVFLNNPDHALVKERLQALGKGHGFAVQFLGGMQNLGITIPRLTIMNWVVQQDFAVLLELHDDMLFPRQWFRPLMAHMRPDVAIATPRLVRCFPRNATAQELAQKVLQLPRSETCNNTLLNHPWLVNVTIAKRIGYYDQSLTPFGGEDEDWAANILLRHGLEIVSVGDSVVGHILTATRPKKIPDSDDPYRYQFFQKKWGLHKIAFKKTWFARTEMYDWHSLQPLGWQPCPPPL